MSECVFQLKDLRFFRVDSFFSKSGEFFAVGKAAKYVQQYKPAEVPKTFGFFELVGLNDFEIVPADELQFKLIVLVKENCLLVSVMNNEGFEHN